MKLKLCIKDHRRGFASSSGHNHLTFSVRLHQINCALLVGPKNHEIAFQYS
jgi:dihydropteroate synthase